MKVAVVVVTFRNSPQQLGACLDSCRQSGVGEFIVVDNSQSSATQALAVRFKAIYISTPKNIGFAAAANLGAAHTQADYLLFLNPDASLTSGALRHALSQFSLHPRIGAVGLLLVSHKLQSELRSFGSPVTPLELTKRKFSLPAIPSAPVSVGWVSGGALLVPQVIFIGLRGFDPSYFMYWEDVDFCRRLRSRGWRVILDPQAKVRHSHGASLSDLALKTGYYDTSADRYFHKYYPRLGWPLYRLLRSLYRFFSPRVV